MGFIGVEGTDLMPVLGIGITMGSQRPRQGFSQELETGCLKLAIVKYLGVQIILGDHNILRFQPQTCLYLSK